MNDVIGEPRSRAQARSDRPALDLDGELTTVRTRGHAARHLVLAAVAAAVVVAVASVFLATQTFRHGPMPPASTAPTQIRNILWQDPGSSGTVVYTGTTIRMFDGCEDRLAHLIIRHQRLIQGRTLGPASTCGGAAVPASDPSAKQAAQATLRRLNHFYAVVAGPASWSRAGGVLALTTRGKGTLRLTAGGPAPTLTDMTWHLVEYMGTDGYEHEAATPLTLNITSEGDFHAKLTCGAAQGHATLSATSLRFADRQPPRCTDRASAVIATLIQAGSVQYAIRGDQLIITAKAGMLIYQP